MPVCGRLRGRRHHLQRFVRQRLFGGDGSDINECEASEEPCKNQKGSRCVNIVGGHICCEEGSDDARCIEEQGVFCAGGCGLNAYCGNKTCECLPGYSGDPLKKCLGKRPSSAFDMTPQTSTSVMPTTCVPASASGVSMSSAATSVVDQIAPSRSARYRPVDPLFIRYFRESTSLEIATVRHQSSTPTTPKKSWCPPNRENTPLASREDSSPSAAE